MIAMSLTLLFHNHALFRRQQDHVVFQAFPMPMRESRLRFLLTLTAPSPAMFVTLKVSAVYRPRDEEGNRIIRVHG
jgi:hypothetical protein